jgi:hypothetical protein
VSTTEQIPFATSCATNLSHLTGQFVAGLCELTRLNMDTCMSMFAGTALRCESLVLAQTPEQFITRQAATFPWFALQIADYTRGWMEIVSATAKPERTVRDHDNGHPARAVLERAANAAPDRGETTISARQVLPVI